MTLVWRPTTASLAARLDAVPAGLSYDPVGATGRAELPSGWRHLDRRWELPAGSFGAAGEAILDWTVLRGAGLAIAAGAPFAAVGTAVLQAFPVGAAGILAPCRVVSVLDGADARGFAYGSVAGHPLVGEESFVVRRADGHTWLEIRSFSRPASASVAAAGPFVRRVQRHAVERYAAAVLRAVR